MALCGILQRLADRAAGRIDRIQDHFDTVASEMFGELRPGTFGVDAFLVDDRDDVNTLAGPQRQRISGTRAAKVAETQATVAVSSATASLARQQQHRAARS